jgi:hypothetical protein
MPASVRAITVARVSLAPRIAACTRAAICGIVSPAASPSRERSSDTCRRSSCSRVRLARCVARDQLPDRGVVDVERERRGRVSSTARVLSAFEPDRLFTNTSSTACPAVCHRRGQTPARIDLRKFAVPHRFVEHVGERDSFRARAHFVASDACLCNDFGPASLRGDDLGLACERTGRARRRTASRSARDARRRDASGRRG